MGNPVTEGYATTSDDTLVMDINLDKLINGFDNLEQILPAIESGVQLGLDELMKRLKDKMLQYLIEYGLGDSPIASDIIVTHIGEGISLTVGSEYAIYVEYGTGLAGSKTPHPKPESWAYMIGEYSKDGNGWWYPTTSTDPNPIKWYSERGLYAFTQAGLPSRPFMYKTWLWGTRSAVQIIKKNIRNELKKIKGVK